jgi:hypothetical protein
LEGFSSDAYKAEVFGLGHRDPVGVRHHGG